MQLCIRKLASLALLAGVLVVAASPSEMKIKKCCTEAGVKNISVPITGYRIQKKNLPCVKAVIFQTTEGEICSHWKEDWVFEKIKELNQRRVKKTTAAPNTTSK